MVSHHQISVLLSEMMSSLSFLELKKGVPVLSVNHGSGTVTLQLPAHASLSDRRWHHLDIISDGKVGHGLGTVFAKSS